LSFVYFGGGTPSLLPLESLQRLFAGLQTVFPWTAAEEITFECAPRSVTPRKLQALREAGVNRISFGVQQMNDEVLRRNGRVQLVADVERAWKQIQEFGFPEVNLDLIAGLVGETETTFRDSLERVIQLGPESVTIYPLEIPPNTPLFRAMQAGGSHGEVPSWSTKRERLAYAFARLEEVGYSLRSAYAAARNSRHRRFAYQVDQYRGVNLLGLGVSSFSYVQGAHYQNVTSVDAYLTAVRAGELPISRGYFLSQEEQFVREFVLQLKLGRVDLEPFRLKFGLDPSNFFALPLARLRDQGWLTFDRQTLTMTRAGLLRVDRLLSEFYLPQHQNLRYW
jgi:oxygen-independent coproporphyrinogen-3 oxidase